ncbi:Hypothetical protein POVN_LOCUS75 [uncultured virus]|nr:Hypothetical protein POVN_LOCUS75 [uncultured virus]
MPLSCLDSFLLALGKSAQPCRQRTLRPLPPKPYDKVKIAAAFAQVDKQASVKELRLFVSGFMLPVNCKCKDAADLRSRIQQFLVG